MLCALSPQGLSAGRGARTRGWCPVPPGILIRKRDTGAASSRYPPRPAPLLSGARVCRHRDAAYRGFLTPATTVLGLGREERAPGEGGSDHEPRPPREKRGRSLLTLPHWGEGSPGGHSTALPVSGPSVVPPGLGPKVESFPEASSPLPSSQLLSSPSGLPLGSFSRINRPRVAKKGRPVLHLIPPGHRLVGFTTLAVTRLLVLTYLWSFSP